MATPIVMGVPNDRNASLNYDLSLRETKTAPCKNSSEVSLLLFCYCDRIPRQKQVRKEMGLFGLMCPERRTYFIMAGNDMASGREGMVSGVRAGWSHCIHTLEAENERKWARQYTPRPAPPDPLCSTSLYLLKVPQLPQSVPPVGDHVLTQPMGVI